MVKIRAWISAARLRTLPLSISGIITGSGLAYNAGYFDWSIFSLSLITTLVFQILSNFANDYGDGVKGTDNADRIGPMRAMQSGLLSASELKNGVIFTAILSVLLSIALIYNAFGEENFFHSMLFFFLGIGAVLAAVRYTVGNKAYGYRGMGDIFVFMFFGLVAVIGCYFLYAKTLSTAILYPAVTVGLLSTGVLNLNNMRDREPDARASKRTLAVLLGESKSKIYHSILIIVAFLMALFYFVHTSNWQWSALAFIAFIPLASHLIKVFKVQAPALLDPELKKVALSTFLFSLLFALGFLL